MTPSHTQANTHTYAHTHHGGASEKKSIYKIHGYCLEITAILYIIILYISVIEGEAYRAFHHVFGPSPNIADISKQLSCNYFVYPAT